MTIEKININDVIFKLKDGLLHNDYGPAIYDMNGNEEWYKDGILHREESYAAAIYGDYHLSYEEGKSYIQTGEFQERPESFKGEDSWYKNGKVVNDNGDIHFYKNGKMHRDGDEPAIILKSGRKVWIKDGLIHRDGGKPAVESDMMLEWFVNGKAHRDDGPAMIVIIGGCPDNNIEKWYLNGQQLSKEEIKALSAKKELDKKIPKTENKQKMKM